MSQAKATQQARKRSDCWERSQVSLPQIGAGFLITQLALSHLNLQGLRRKHWLSKPFKITFVCVFIVCVFIRVHTWMF